MNLFSSAIKQSFELTVAPETHTDTPAALTGTGSLSFLVDAAVQSISFESGRSKHEITSHLTCFSISVVQTVSMSVGESPGEAHAIAALANLLSKRRMEELHPPQKKEGKRQEKKTAEKINNFVCSHCAATATPQPRSGPLGPKTLCNACGLKYAKKIKNNSKDADRINEFFSKAESH